METRDFGNVERDVIRELYASAQRTLDDLPYTLEFEKIYEEFIRQTGRTSATRHDVWKYSPLFASGPN